VSRVDANEEHVAEIIAKRGGKKAPAKGKGGKAKSADSTRQRARVAKITTEQRKQTFLDELARRGIVTDAAIAAGVDRKTPYLWHAKDEQFAAAWVDALEQATDAMEAEAFRRAVEGIDKPVFQGGRKVGSIREYSDTLLVHMLKANRPSKYRERFELTGANGGPIQHADVTDAPLEDLLAEAESLLRRAATVGDTEPGDRA
jgi:hypothetical protein